MKGGQTLKVLCIGECMVEFSPSRADPQVDQPGQFQRGFAGDSYNTAVYLARQFSPQVQVSYCTALGVDALSREMLSHFQQEGIHTDNVRLIEDRQPGLYLIENDAKGERFFQYWRSQSAARSMFSRNDADGLADEFARFDAVYLSGISLAILDEVQRSKLFSALSLIESAGGTQIAFDPNFRPALWPDRDQARTTLQHMASLADLALVTMDDDHAVWGDGASIDAVADRWLRMGAGEVVVKDGASECLITTKAVRLIVRPQDILEPVDTTGAGDAFAAGYLGARLQDMPPKKAAMLAHEVAGQVIMHPGGVIAKDCWQKVNEE